MTDELTPELVLATLHAGHGDDVHRLFQELRSRADTGRSITLPRPTHEWLEALDEVSDETVVIFLDLLRDYPRFTPPLTPEQVREESLEANLRHGSHRSGFHHALLMSTALSPDLETAELLLKLGTRGIDGERETEAAKWLVSYLLDNPVTRRAVVRVLWWMQEREDLAPIVDYVRPQLESEELADLD